MLGGAWVLLAVCWWGASSLWGWAWGLCCCGRTGALSGSRPTPVAPRWGVLPPPPLVGGCGPPCWGAARLLLFWCGGVLGSALPPGPGRVLGLWWLWWVVCDLYSGCEHLCCLRASPFFVLSCACAWGVGGRVARGAAVLWWWSWACFLLCVVLWGIRWMPWHQELMKDVAACDMPRGVGERALIRGCPNGGTRPGLCWATII